MIYTVTFNPALDYAVGVEGLKPGMTNRADYEQLLPGGKGINVSTVLNNLGIENIALGFIAGFTGDEIKRRFEGLGGKSDFITLKCGVSRINVKIKSDTETEINGIGPVIDNESAQRLMNKLDNLKSGDVLVLAGSIPSSLPDNLYSDIMQMLSGRDVLIAVDAAGDLLLNTLAHKPFLIKPNNCELGEIFGTELKTREEVIPYARKLQGRGAQNVLVSMAGEGAVLITADGNVLMSEAPKGTVQNSVGAGDSMLAGFIAGWCSEHNYVHAFKMGLSAGSASAFSSTLATKSEIIKVYNSFEILAGGLSPL